jgi:hypothetical protein
MTLKCSWFLGFVRSQNSEENTKFHKPDLLPHSDENVKRHLRCWTKQNDYLSQWPSVVRGITKELTKSTQQASLGY